MTRQLTAPFFEIGPKNLLRRVQLEAVVRAAGLAGADFGVTVVVTVPTALVAPVADLGAGVLVFGQELSADPLGPSVGSVTAEALLDAGADGVMLNHDSNPLSPSALASTTLRAREVGLQTILCAGSAELALHAAALAPSAVLYEPPELIGTAGSGARSWIPTSNEAVRREVPGVLMMHAGGVSTPDIARAIIAAGADGTGSTSGVLAAADPVAAARLFIAAARAGFSDFQSTTHHPSEGAHS